MDEKTLKVVLAMKDQVSAVAKTVGGTFRALGAGIVSAMKAAKDGVEKLWGAVQRVGAGIKSMASTVAGWTRNVGLASAALLALNVHTAQHIDELNDMAKALGLTVETVSLLEYAAGRAGTQLSEIVVAIRAVSAQAQQFKAGSQESIELFSALGVDPTGKGPLELVEEVATGIDKMTDKAEKLALAQDLLGKSGFKVIELFRDGGKELRTLAGDAEKFGAIIDTSLANKAEALADAWINFKKGLASVGNEILRGAGADITDFLNSVGSTLARSRFTVGAFFGALAESFKQFAALWKSGGVLNSASGFAALLAETLKSAFVNVTPAVFRSALELGKIIGAAIVGGIFGETKRALAEDLEGGGLGAQIIRKMLPDKARAELDRLADLLRNANEFDAQTAGGSLLGASGINIQRQEFERLAAGNLNALTAHVRESAAIVAEAWEAAGRGIESDLGAAYARFLATADDKTRAAVEKIVSEFKTIPERAKLQEALGMLDPESGAFLVKAAEALVGGGPADLAYLNKLLDDTIAHVRALKKEATPKSPVALVAGESSEAAKGMGTLADSTTLFADAARDARKAVAETGGVGDTGATTFLGGMVAEARELSEQFRGAAAVGRQTASDLHGAFSNNFFRAMRSEFRTFGDFVKSFMSNLVQGIQRQLSNAAGSVFVDLIGSIIGGFGGGGLPKGWNSVGYSGVGPPSLDPGSSAFFGGGSGSAKSGVAGGISVGAVHVHVSAIDTQSGVAFVEKNIETIAGRLASKIAQNGQIRAQLQSGLQP